MVEEAGVMKNPSGKPVIFSLGKNVRIEVWSGLNTIGGNCVVVKDRSEAIILDQGINFTVFKKYYGGFIQPEIVEDLREVGAIPPKTIYEGASEIHISHLHLDHLGSLAIPFEYDVRVYVPSRHVLEKLSNFWYWSWKELLLPSTFDLSELKDAPTSERVRLIRVSHSAYPSYSFLIETFEGNIFYTGDFRINSPIGVVNTLENYQKVLEDSKVDMLIIEGTNFSRRMTPLTAEDVKNMLVRILNKYNRKYIFISAHPLDIESFLLVSNILKNKEYELVLTHAKYAELLDVQLEELRARDMAFFLLPLKGSCSEPLEHIKKVELRDISDKRVAFFTSIMAVSEMNMLKRRGINLEGLLQITLTGEPLEEEGRIMEARLGNWIRRFGMNSIQLHLSGHYYPYMFKDILRVVKPRKLIPIHTKAPNTMLTLFNKYK